MLHHEGGTPHAHTAREHVSSSTLKPLHAQADARPNFAEG